MINIFVNSFDTLYNMIMEEVAISTSLNYVHSEEVHELTTKNTHERNIDIVSDDNK